MAAPALSGDLKEVLEQYQVSAHVQARTFALTYTDVAPFASMFTDLANLIARAPIELHFANGTHDYNEDTSKRERVRILLAWAHACQNLKYDQEPSTTRCGWPVSRMGS